MNTLKDFLDNLPPDAKITVTFGPPPQLPEWIKPITMTPQQKKTLNDQLRKALMMVPPATDMLIVWDSITEAGA